MPILNRFLTSSVLLSSLIAFGCQQKSSGPREDSKALPKALVPYRGGGQPPQTEVPKTKLQRSAEIMKFDDADGLDFDLKNRCAIELCGPVFNQSDSTQPQDSENSKKVDAKFKSDFALVQPLLKSIVEQEIINQKLGIQKIDEAKEQLLIYSPTSKQTKLINLLWSSRHLGDIYGMWNGKSFDEVAAKKALEGKVADVDLPLLFEMASTFLQLPQLRHSMEIDGLGVDLFFENLAGSSDPAFKRKAAQEWARTTLAQANDVRAQFPLIFSDPFPALENLSAGKDLSSELASKLSEEVGAALLYPILNEAGEPFLKRKVEFPSLAKEYFHSARAKLLDETTESKKALRLSNANLTCGNAIFGFSALQKFEEEGLKTAPQLIETVRATVLKTIPELSTDASVTSAVQNKVRAVRFQTPDRLEVGFAKLRKSLQDQLKEEKESAEYIARGKVEDLAIFVAAAVYRDEKDDDDLVDECRSQDPTRYNDNSKSGFGMIQISWRTILQSETGFGVIAHEFGHEVSSQFRANEADVKKSLYAQLVSCLVVRKSDPSAETSEEDFADTFAARVIKRYRAENPAAPAQTNFACSLMNRDQQRWGTNAGLSLKYPDSYKDTHSTHFYRALQYKIDVEEPLSEACAQVVAKGRVSMANSCDVR